MTYLPCKGICSMRTGNLMLLLALLVLSSLTYMDYSRAQTEIKAELHYLRVQKSLQNRQSFEKEYGPGWKQEIRCRMNENKALLVKQRDIAMYKMFGIAFLNCGAVSLHPVL